MKKTLIILFAAMLMVFGTACGESEDNPDNKDSVQIQVTSRNISETEGVILKEEVVKKATKPNSDITEPTNPTEPTTPEKKKKKKKRSNSLPTQGDVVPNTYVAVTTAPNGSFDKSDLDFIYEGAYICLNDEIDDAIAILGDDNAANELSKTKTEYEFDNVIVVTYESNGKERIEQITVITDAISTKKGAKIGMYGTQLRTVYGVPAKKSETEYTYTIGNKSLIFNIENNIVTSYCYKLTH